MKRIQWILCFAFLFSCQLSDGGQPKTNQYESMAAVTGDGKGAVASVNSLATQLGLEAFAKGGNAIDAAAAVAFALGVVDTPNSGIGGGCFILVHWADGRVEAIDGREMAPAAATAELYLVDGKYQPQLSKTGALAIGVPGSVAALEALVKRGGKLKWQEAILPAAALADSGFAIDGIYSKRLGWVAEHMQKYPGSAAVFLDEKGKPLLPGTTLKQPDLAATYRKLAKQGSEYFYRGEFAQKMDEWMKANGGLITAKDFANYRVLDRTPVKTAFNGYQVFGFPPPSSGGTHVAQILNILETFPIATAPEADRYHLILEAMKRAFADRAYWMGDADFADVPRGLLDKSYAKKLASTIVLDKATPVKTYGTPPNVSTDLFNRHTTHIATADAEGNWVAITTTLNTSFGSKVTIPGTGVVMNNQMDDFAAQTGQANAFGLVGDSANKVEARKRPLSSMSPTIVLKNGKPVMTVGAAGGPTIINQVVQVLVNRLALNMPLEQALNSPRVHHQWKPEKGLIDPFASEELKQELKKRGHDLRDWPGFGSTQAIALEKDGFVAVAEPRLKERMQ
nr:gamma-glutamyltransferase [Teredinibacter franksiae]